MKKSTTLTLFITALLITSLIIPIAHAKKEENPGKHKGKYKHAAAQNGLEKGKSPVQHLYLYEKDPDTREIIEDGAWGKVTILTHKDKFVFNGHGLEETTEYSLINFAPEAEWPTPSENPWYMDHTHIGTEETGDNRNIHIKGDWADTIHGKVWLVKTRDFNLETEEMISWKPEEYLFEFDLLPPQIE
jgi:hypothetical protein